ncbi:uncharacterized protein LOC108739484 [Agrilus planipennis]|uniref:Uncharacterized protein LOC108739484 n=1 Tax=Agrilus planipennis TaxID=224129 RepID=A0A1W4X7T4_AGRPL|nr:uncharacterized protein LOC108739484 [Agrilus planipennis]
MGSIIVLLSGFIIVNSVQINYILVPQAVQNNSHQPIIIDCNYSLRPDGTDLVLQWYLNEQKIYHWVPPNKPQALGLLKDRLDLNFEASVDVLSRYRALKIENPTVDLAGEYKCYVSTSIDEDFATRKLIVFEPEKLFFLNHSYEDAKTVNFTCVVADIYPEPSMIIYTNKKEKRLDRILQPIQWGTSKEQNGRYTMTLTASTFIETLDAGSVISCELRIPGTSYSKRKTLLYYPLEMRSWNRGPIVGGSYLHVSILLICQGSIIFL